MGLFDTPTKTQLIDKASDVVKTLVFLKVNVNDINNGEVTEISAIAVHMNELKSQFQQQSTVRIVDKLNLCFDPVTCYNVHMESLQKMNNEMLKHACKRQFDIEAFFLFHFFLQRQNGPLCFVCHNGFRSDFQILQSKIQQLGRSLETINGLDIYCADSLWTYKTIDANLHNGSNSVRIRCDVSVFDMIYYTLSALCSRYLKRSIPDQLTAEESNLHLCDLVFCSFPSFLNFLCCKKFALVRPLSQDRTLTRVPYGLSNPTGVVSESSSIETNVFVFFDLETTSLHDSRITEICLCAVHKSSIYTLEKSDTPRIHDKLLLILNPEIDIQPRASEITKLSNRSIKNSLKPEFNSNCAGAFAQFLLRQAQPICLVAHNGLGFDFKILRRYLQDHQQAFPIFSTVFCSDTIPAFRATEIGDEISNSQPGQRLSYSLPKVYRRCFNCPPNSSHSAEADVMTMLKIVCYKPDTLLHLDREKKLLL